MEPLPFKVEWSWMEEWRGKWVDEWTEWVDGKDELISKSKKTKRFWKRWWKKSNDFSNLPLSNPERV